MKGGGCPHPAPQGPVNFLGSELCSRTQLTTVFLHTRDKTTDKANTLVGMDSQRFHPPERSQHTPGGHSESPSPTNASCPLPLAWRTRFRRLRERPFLRGGIPTSQGIRLGQGQHGEPLVGDIPEEFAI